MKRTSLALLLGALLALAACGEEGDRTARPKPLEPTAEAVGHYCGMNLVEHSGPKGQIFVESRAQPVWFTSVRDTIAFTLLPEETDRIAAIYVNDMAKASNWDQPEPGSWVEAREALYVLGSGRRGGMGAPEAVPFSERAAAEAFVVEHGGQIVAFGEIPQDAILGPTGASPAADGESDAGQTSERHQDHE